MECLAGICVVVCMFLNMIRCGMSGWCTCCGVFVSEHEKVWDVWLVCVVVCLFLNMIRCGMFGWCVCCGVFVSQYDELWDVWLVCVLWCVCS